jgi:hypothetical protein
MSLVLYFCIYSPSLLCQSKGNNNKNKRALFTKASSGLVAAVNTIAIKFQLDYPEFTERQASNLTLKGLLYCFGGYSLYIIHSSFVSFNHLLDRNPCRSPFGTCFDYLYFPVFAGQSSGGN